MSHSSKPIPLAIPNELLAKIDYATSRMPHKSKQDVMRMAMELGLLDLQAMDYDVEGHAWRAMKAAQQPRNIVPLMPPALLDRVAEASPLPMAEPVPEHSFTADEAEILQLAEHKRSLERKLSTAAKRHPKARGTPAAESEP